MTIGLTGLFCSGKSTVESILKKEYGFYVIDVDKIGHLALIEKKDEIVKNFNKVILTDNEVDRKKLGKLVFNDNKKLKILNSIVHPIMIEKVKNEISKTPNKNILINAALLFEMGLNSLCSSIIAIKAPKKIILKRAKKRCNYSETQIYKILINQKVLQFAKKNEKKADIFYVNNNKDLDSLKKQIKRIFEERIRL